MIFEKVEEFNPDLIFDCGQCFRWEREADGSYLGIAGNKVARVTYNQERLTVENKGFNSWNDPEEEKAFWTHYFALEMDYKAIREELSAKDPVVAKAAEYGAGIRILNQDKWETLVSFIISANNNIPRIKKNINCLAQNFGEKVGTVDQRDFYALPEPEVLAKLTEEDLAPCRLGYRAKYLIDTAKMVSREGQVTYERLKDYCGVGPKVASCISLFSMGKYDSFPIDVWVIKVMSQLYGIENKKAMTQFAQEKFGEYSGIAQQYLFYYMRYVNEE